MASSRKPRPGKATDLVSRVAGTLQKVVEPGARLTLGLSGGIDSVVLLDILRRLARPLRFRLSALHVNHGISPRAGRWAAFCRGLCRAHRVPFKAVKVDVARGESLEAAARAARYRVFRGQEADYVVLAHHLDDQVETLLLQLLRGAGVKGLAGMPLVRIQDSGFGIQRKTAQRAKRRSLHSQSRIASPALLRPLLDVPRSEIAAYARKRRLAWVEDESNLDPCFDRNFLRHRALPLIEQRFPGYRKTLARAAAHLAEASRVLDDLAARDGAPYVRDGALGVESMRRLSHARAKNLLRHFVSLHGVTQPNAERLEEALRQAVAAKDDARVCIDFGEADLRRFAGALYLVPKSAVPSLEFCRAWRNERKLALPKLRGVLTMTPSRGKGMSLARLKTAPVTIRVRRGGERLRPDRRRPRRSLKNLLQEARIAPWERDRLPLLYCGEALAWVPGIGIACEFQAERREAAVLPRWIPGN